MSAHHADFYRADLSAPWVGVLRLLNQWLVLPWLGIRVDIPAADLARLRSLPQRASIIMASNHPSFADPAVLFEVMRQWGRMGYFVAARVLFTRMAGVQGFIIRKAGCFSVSPGGNNKAAVEYAQDRLREARHPVVIFPEGHTFYLNDVILPLKPGVADWALQMASEGLPSYVVPLAIKYHYRSDIRKVLDQSVSRMERRVIPEAPDLPPGDFWSRLYLRLYRVGDVVLSRHEEQYRHTPPRGLDIDERVASLSEFLIQDLERKYRVDPHTGSTLFDRARHLMAILEEDTNADHASDAAEARFAWALSTFYAGYLTPDSSPERFAETVMKFNRELFDKIPVTMPLRRRAAVRIGPVLDAGEYLRQGGDPPRDRLLHDLAHTLESQVQAMQETLR